MSGYRTYRDGRGRLGNVLSNLAVAVGCVLFLGGFAWGAVVYKPYTVPTDSMTPTVNAGDRVLAERVDGGDVRRGDVVVFTDSTWGDVPMVKRVVGVGGDKVACCDKDGRLTVNGKPIDEPYLRAEGASRCIGAAAGLLPRPRSSRPTSPRGSSSSSGTSAAPPWTPGSTSRTRAGLGAAQRRRGAGGRRGLAHGRHDRPARAPSRPCPAACRPSGPLPLQVGAVVVGCAAHPGRSGLRPAGGALRTGDASGRGRPPVPAEARKVARVVLLDPDDRILLLHGFEPADPADELVVHPGRRPGGRRDPRGGRAAGAGRGDRDHRTSPSARCCGRGSAPSRSTGGAGTRTSGTSWPVPSQTATDQSGLTELELRSVAGLRWWTSAELLATRETVYPTRLAGLLRTLLDEGPPGVPLVLAPEIV